MAGGATSLIFKILFLGWWIAITGNNKIGILLATPNYDLECIKELFDSGKVTPVIDKCLTLSQLPEALQYIGEGNVKGKIVISMYNDNS